MIVAANVTGQIGSYLQDLILVYIIMIMAHIVLQMLFGAGVRPPYARWSEAIINFLRDVSEPLLRVFRKVLPALGPLDLSPMLALVLLWILRDVVGRLLHG
ncbi:MAG: YggT family protein [Solirubrobacterales bacterium]|nr:YggT family protein [Solirubrobacterales bacterium]